MNRPSRAAQFAAISTVGVLMLAACAQGDSGGGNGAGGDPTGDSTEATESEPTETESTAPPGNGELKIGTLLPVTGDLAYLGPPEFAGVDLAIEEINEAGGVLGKPVTTAQADSGDGTPKIAPQGADKLLNAGVDAVIGAASSSVSLSFIDTLVNAKVVQFSPANTSTEFDTYDDNGYYFRTAPSDVLQGAVLGNLVADDDNKNVAIMARQDSYGEALAENVTKALNQRGVDIATTTLYSADAQSFTAEVNEIAASNPDSLVLIAFQETTKIIPRLIAAGVGPQDIRTYFVDGNISQYGTGKDGFPAGTLEGVKNTAPAVEISEDFRQRLLDIDPKLEEFTYGPEAYDATIMTALAAVAAGSDSGEAISGEIINISRDGTECTGFQECADLLEQGEDIDYAGVSGPQDLNDTGSPSKASIGIFKYDAQNTYEVVDYVEGVVE